MGIPSRQACLRLLVLRTTGASVHRYFAAAACSMILATSPGWETITTCDAPFTTTVSFEPARFAMKDSAAPGMFKSRSP